MMGIIHRDPCLPHLPETQNAVLQKFCVRLTVDNTVRLLLAV